MKGVLVDSLRVFGGDVARVEEKKRQWTLYGRGVDIKTAARCRKRCARG